MTFSPAVSRVSREAEVTRRDAVVGLAVLTSLNLLNYFDRFVVSAVLPTLKSHAGLDLTGTQAGWLGSAFMIVYTLTSPALGIFGDRVSRLRVIALGVAVWSVATMASGLALTFLPLLAARAVVGIGEAAFAPHAPPMLSDWFPKEKRARIFSLYYAAFPFGTALGVIFGSAIDRHLNWRVAFFLAGLPGLFLAARVLRLRPGPRGGNDEAIPDTDPFWVTLRTSLLRNPTFILTVLGYAAYSAVFGAFLFWMPTYLASLQPDGGNAPYVFGLVVAVAGMLGTFAGGAAGDFFFRRNKQAYLWLSATTTLLGAGALFVSLSGTGTLAFAASGLFAFLLYTVTAPVNGALVNSLPPSVRGAGLAINVFTIHVLGDAWSPVVIGRASDRMHSLGEAMRLFLPPLLVVAAAAWGTAALQDRRRARGPGQA